MRNGRRGIVAWGIIVLVLACAVPGETQEFRPGQWAGGAGLGFLGNTVDGTAFALNGNADYFYSPFLSFGPLMQLAFTGDLAQIAMSGQAKYWWDIPQSGGRARLVGQGGLGFVHADRARSDTSWILPFGLTLDYSVTPRLALTATFLLNFTDLDTGNGKSTSVMPGMTFGARF